MSYDIDMAAVPNKVDDIVGDMIYNHRDKLGVFYLSAEAEDYFRDGFAEDVAEQIKYEKYDDIKGVIRRLLKLACLISVERAFQLHPMDRALTPTDVWYGLAAARWAACPLPPAYEGRWCNFVKPCPPDDPDCEQQFNFRAGSKHPSS